MLEGELTPSVVAQTVGCSRWTCYAVLRAYQAGGWEALEGGVRGRPALVLTVEQRQRIVAWRRETEIGAVRMERLMKEGTTKWPADWPVVSHQRIQALFAEAGLTRDVKPRGKKPTYVRFEREHSNS